MGTPKTIYQKAIRGGQYIFLGRIVQQVLVTAQLIVLARVLAPRDFGLMGMVLLAISVINLFTNPGLVEAFVQKKEYDNQDLSAIWTFGILRGGVLFIVVFLLSPLAASFFDNNGIFKPNHILKPKVLVNLLVNSEDPVIQTVSNRLSPETRQAMREHVSDNRIPDELQGMLVSDLNSLVRTPGFYQNDFFSDLTNQEEFQRKIQYFPDNTQKINRLLLENIFNKQIRKIIFAPQQICLALRILGATFILGALGNIGIVLFRRSLEFKTQVLWNTLKIIVSVSITIILAVILRSFWALVYGRVLSAAILSMMSYKIHPFRPAFTLDFKRIKYYWDFGKHILSSSILRFLILEGDDIFVGKMLGPVSLGFYRYAYKFANMVATQVGDVITQITFPTLSRLQDNIPKMRAGYIKSTQSLSLIIYPVSGGLFILAADFISVVLGDQWLSIVPTMRILCLLGVSRSLQVGSVVRSLGRPDISVKVLCIRLLLIVISIYPLTMKYGLPGTALSVTVSTIIILPVLLYYVQTMIGHSVFEYIKLVSLPILGTLIMGICLVALRMAIGVQNIFTFVFYVITGTIVYSCSVLLLQRFYKDYNIISLFKEITISRK